EYSTEQWSRADKWILMLLISLVLATAGTFFSVVWTKRPQTRYAAGFDERTFVSMPLGLTADEVVRRLGPPLQKKEDPDGTAVWYYSEGLSKNFAHRALVIDQSGRLIHKTAWDIWD